MDIIMECKNVDYSYPLTTEPAIKHLNLQIERGKFYGVMVKMDQVRRHYVLYCEDLLQVFIKGK